MPMSDSEAQSILETARGTAKLAWFPRVGDPLSGGTEVSGAGYGRQNVDFGAPAGRLMVNTNTVAFPAPLGSWGLITHAALMDAMSGGTVRYSFLLPGTDEQRTMVVGAEPIVFGPGTVSMVVP
jgi:hypothetical protein